MLEVGIKRLLGTLSMEYWVLSSGSSGIICFYRNVLGFPHSSVGKESTCSAEDLGLISGLGRSPGEGIGYPLCILAWRIPWTEDLAGYSPWGQKELDTTE